MARRGTEAFPDLGAHCDREDCNQLDFLPFDCDGCGGVFCAAHRTYGDHGCARAADRGRTVVVCEACGDAIERVGKERTDAEILEAHARSTRGCDPARKRKPRCPARRCKETLTFSNTSVCKGCGLKLCLKHRFPARRCKETLTFSNTSVCKGCGLKLCLKHRCPAGHECALAAGAAAAAAARRAGDCGRDAQKMKDGGGWALPPLVRNFRMF